LSFGANVAATRFMFERDHARVVIPMHAAELKRKTLRAIIQDLKITVEEFQEML
jgi:ATP sulfurylase